MLLIDSSKARIQLNWKEKYNFELSWDGELQAERRFFVRSNEEYLEFLTVNLDNLSHWYGDPSKGDEIEVIGGSQNCMIGKKLYSEDKHTQRVMDDLGRVFKKETSGISGEFTCYVSSHDELVTLITKALGKVLTKKESESLYEYHFGTRDDMWK